MFEDYPTKQEATRTAKEYAEPLNKLINPSDIQEDVTSWNDINTDRLNQEVYSSVSVMRSEHRQVRNMIQDRAFRIWTDSLTRVSDDALSADVSDEELIFTYGIWPYKMDKWECYEICHTVFENPSVRIPQWAYDDAEEEITDGLYEGTVPV
jgi:hypothetical protein